MKCRKCGADEVVFEPKEVEKEFEEWWQKEIWGKRPADILHYPVRSFMKEAYLEAHSCQQREIDRLREGVGQAIKEVEWFGQPGRIFQHTDAINIIGKLQKLLEGEE